MHDMTVELISVRSQWLMMPVELMSVRVESSHSDEE